MAMPVDVPVFFKTVIWTIEAIYELCEYTSKSQRIGDAHFCIYGNYKGDYHEDDY